MPIFYNNKEFKHWPYNPRYFVSQDGDVLSFYYREPRLLRPKIGKNGYKSLRVVNMYCHNKEQDKLVHNMVLEAWVSKRPFGNSRVYHAAHLDNDRLNNKLENLRWVTMKENNKQRADSGVQKGGRNPSAKLTEACVRQIRKMRRSGITQSQCAKKFGVKKSTIKNIDRRASWSWLDSEVAQKT